MVLVDLPLDDAYYVDTRKDTSPKVQVCLEPFRGVYEDFMEPCSVHESLNLPATKRGKGMSYDLEQYWERGIPRDFDARCPTIQAIAYYPLQIVAAEWVKYVAVMHDCLVGHEYKDNNDPALKSFDTRLQELQSWRRRALLSQRKVRSVLRLLNSWRTDTPSDTGLLPPLIIDFEYISTNLDEYSRMLESSIAVFTSVVQIAEAQRSFNEASNIKRLTILALIFVPLSYVSSLFSMNSINGPGGSYFWVYFVVAIPVTLLVVLIARAPNLETWLDVSSLQRRWKDCREQ